MTAASFPFAFPGFVHPGSCFISIQSSQGSRSPCVVCSQKRNYAGTSITNAVESIASTLYATIVQPQGLMPYGRKAEEVGRALRKYWTASLASNRGPVALHQLYGRDTVRWVEHYPAGTGLANGDIFREILFDTNDSPLWQSAQRPVDARREFGQSLIDLAMQTANGAQ